MRASPSWLVAVGERWAEDWCRRQAGMPGRLAGRPRGPVGVDAWQVPPLLEHHVRAMVSPVLMLVWQMQHTPLRRAVVVGAVVRGLSLLGSGSGMGSPTSEGDCGGESST